MRRLCRNYQVSLIGNSGLCLARDLLLCTIRSLLALPSGFPCFHFSGHRRWWLPRAILAHFTSWLQTMVAAAACLPPTSTFRIASQLAASTTPPIASRRPHLQKCLRRVESRPARVATRPARPRRTRSDLRDLRDRSSWFPALSLMRRARGARNPHPPAAGATPTRGNARRDGLLGPKRAA